MMFFVYPSLFDLYEIQRHEYHPYSHLWTYIGNSLGIVYGLKVTNNLISRRGISYNDVRGKELLQSRINYNQHRAQTLNNNPYVNNFVYKGTEKNDKLRNISFVYSRNN